MSLTTWFRAINDRFQAMLGPINRWPTWLNEGVGGMLMMLPVPVLMMHPHWWTGLAVGLWGSGMLLASQWYEHGTITGAPASPDKIPDSHGWNPEDALWRGYGMAVMLLCCLCWSLLR